MIVCVCGNVSSKQIDEAIKSGHDTLEDLQIELAYVASVAVAKSS